MKNIRENSQYRAELVAGGGKTQVPCLRIEDENQQVHWLYESRDIVEYLRNRNTSDRN